MPDAGLTRPEQIAREREIYRRYQEYFSVPSEGP